MEKRYLNRNNEFVLFTPREEKSDSGSMKEQLKAEIMAELEEEGLLRKRRVKKKAASLGTAPAPSGSALKGDMLSTEGGEGVEVTLNLPIKE